MRDLSLLSATVSPHQQPCSLQSDGSATVTAGSRDLRPGYRRRLATSAGDRIPGRVEHREHRQRDQEVVSGTVLWGRPLTEVEGDHCLQELRLLL